MRIKIDAEYVRKKILTAQMADEFPKEPPELLFVGHTGRPIGRLNILEAHLLVAFLEALDHPPRHQGESATADWLTYVSELEILFKHEVAKRHNLNSGQDFVVGISFSLYLEQNPSHDVEAKALVCDDHASY